MGTEILRPQNCLIERIRLPPTSCLRRRYGNGSFNRKPVQWKRVVSEREISKKFSSDEDLKKVTILRRGESLDSKMLVTGTDRLGPDPVMVPKNTVVATGKSDVYAGSGFFVSPSPSSLPLPSFSKKKNVLVDDSATRDLRRLLRLDL